MSKLRRDERLRLVRMYVSGETCEKPIRMPLDRIPFWFSWEDEPRDRLRARGLIKLVAEETHITEHGAFKRNRYAITYRGKRVVEHWLHDRPGGEWVRKLIGSLP